jgi:hypothetical protein
MATRAWESAFMATRAWTMAPGSEQVPLFSGLLSDDVGGGLVDAGGLAAAKDAVAHVE